MSSTKNIPPRAEVQRRRQVVFDLLINGDKKPNNADIAKLFGITINNANSVMAGMRREGLATSSRRSDDRSDRMVYWTATEKGIQYAAAGCPLFYNNLPRPKKVLCGKRAATIHADVAHDDVRLRTVLIRKILPAAVMGGAA